MIKTESNLITMKNTQIDQPLLLNKVIIFLYEAIFFPKNLLGKIILILKLLDYMIKSA
jgi:hypothetical protein